MYFFPQQKGILILIIKRKHITSFVISIRKKCVESCEMETNNEKKYYDEDALICIENCTNTLKKYNTDYKCVESCEKFHNYGMC